MLERNDLAALLHAVLADLGLGCVEGMQVPEGDSFFVERGITGYSMIANVFFAVKLDQRELETRVDAIREVQKKTDFLRQSILKSPFIAEMAAKLEAAEREVERLTPYKIHFDFEKELRSGRD